MIPFAQARNFNPNGDNAGGASTASLGWEIKDRDRLDLRAQLDAAFFLLYAISHDDPEYILSTFSNTGFIPADQRDQQGTLWQHGSIGERVLDAYDSLQSQSA